MVEDCIYFKRVDARDDFVHEMCHRINCGTHCVKNDTCPHYKTMVMFLDERFEIKGW